MDNNKILFREKGLILNLTYYTVGVIVKSFNSYSHLNYNIFAGLLIFFFD